METAKKIKNIITLYESFITITKNYSDELNDKIVKSILSKNHFGSQEEIIEKYNNRVAKDRILKIGIIGSVKAGKSTLINSLVFDGKDILPKAATPMTAALTTLSYGENLMVRKNFFTDDDLQKLKEISEAYDEELKIKQNEKYSEKKDSFLKKRRRQGFSESKIPSEKEDEFRTTAMRMAERELKSNIQLAGAKEQWEQICNSSITKEALGDEKTISLDSIEELPEILSKHVGANEKYVPFTQSVDIKIPEVLLEDLLIIDTPGFNDPIPSRENRTRELLFDCDVIFILSKAGHFLPESDLVMLNNITEKTGIREISVIASQVDTELWGSEKDKGKGKLADVLKSIRKTLVNRIAAVSKDTSREKIFEKIIEKPEKYFLWTSGQCQAMVQRWDDFKNWDEELIHTWHRLETEYSDYFNRNKVDNSKSNLLLLGNMEKVESILDGVRKEKEAILEERFANFLPTYRNGATEIKKELLEIVNQRITFIETEQLSDVTIKIEKMQGVLNSLKSDIQNRLNEYIPQWFMDCRNKIDTKIMHAFESAESSISSSEKIRSETFYETKGILFWERKIPHVQNKRILSTAEIKNSIKLFIDDYNQVILFLIENEIEGLKLKLGAEIVNSWNTVAPDIIQNPSKLKNIVRASLESIPPLHVTVSDCEYKKWKNGMLYDDSEIDEYLETARLYSADLQSKFRAKSRSDLDGFYSALKNINITDELVADIFNTLEQEKKALEKPKESKERLQSCKQALEEIQITL